MFIHFTISLDMARYLVYLVNVTIKLNHVEISALYNITSLANKTLRERASRSSHIRCKMSRSKCNVIFRWEFLRSSYHITCYTSEQVNQRKHHFHNST